MAYQRFKRVSHLTEYFNHKLMTQNLLGVKHWDMGFRLTVPFLRTTECPPSHSWWQEKAPSSPYESSLLLLWLCEPCQPAGTDDHFKISVQSKTRRVVYENNSIYHKNLSTNALRPFSKQSCRMTLSLRDVETGLKEKQTEVFRHKNHIYKHMCTDSQKLYLFMPGMFPQK